MWLTRTHTDGVHRSCAHRSRQAESAGVAHAFIAPTPHVHRSTRGVISFIPTLIVAIAFQGVRGLYRGFGSTVMREVPFSFLQFPMWEFFKVSIIYLNKIISFSSHSEILGRASGPRNTPLAVSYLWRSIR
jgi:hypothetical protein